MVLRAIGYNTIFMQLTICLLTHFCRVIVQFGKVGFGPAMRINIMNDAQDPYENEENAIREKIRVGNAET